MNTQEIKMTKQLTHDERTYAIGMFNYHARSADMIIQKGRRTIDEALDLQRHQREYKKYAQQLGCPYLATVNGVTVAGPEA